MCQSSARLLQSIPSSRQSCFAFSRISATVGSGTVRSKVRSERPWLLKRPVGKLVPHWAKVVLGCSRAYRPAGRAVLPSQGFLRLSARAQYAPKYEASDLGCSKGRWGSWCPTGLSRRTPAPPPALQPRRRRDNRQKYGRAGRLTLGRFARRNKVAVASGRAPAGS